MLSNPLLATYPLKKDTTEALAKKAPNAAKKSMFSPRFMFAYHPLILYHTPEALAIDDLKKLLENELKVYVDVLEDRLKDGTILPRAITWEDGATYEIDQIMDRRKAASLRCGGAGLRYKVRIGDTVTYMWLEEDKWFVQRREAA